MEQSNLFESGKDQVCLLEKSIYGLKQAARCWHDHLGKILSTLGLHKLKPELALQQMMKRSLIVGFYVDDLIILCHDIELIGALKSNFGKVVEITDKGEIQTFVGLEIKRDGKSLRISQAKYIQPLRGNHQVENSHPIPLPDGFVMEPTQLEAVIQDVPSYQSIVGELLYLANMSRSDICFAVGRLSRHMNNPRKKHMDLVKQVLRQVKRTKKAESVYRGKKSGMAGFADAHYANGSDSRTTTGWMFFC